MSIWQSDEQLAMQELAVAIQHSADQYSDAAGILEGQAAATTMEALSVQRQQWADVLQEAIRKLGDLPAVPDQDLEAGEKLISRVKAAFTGDELATVLEERIEDEQRIRELIETGRGTKLPDFCETIIDGLDKDVDNVLAQLSQLQASR